MNELWGRFTYSHVSIAKVANRQAFVESPEWLISIHFKRSSGPLHLSKCLKYGFRSLRKRSWDLNSDKLVGYALFKLSQFHSASFQRGDLTQLPAQWAVKFSLASKWVSLKHYNEMIIHTALVLDCVSLQSKIRCLHLFKKSICAIWSADKGLIGLQVVKSAYNLTRLTWEFIDRNVVLSDVDLVVLDQFMAEDSNRLVFTTKGCSLYGNCMLLDSMNEIATDCLALPSIKKDASNAGFALWANNSVLAYLLISEFSEMCTIFILRNGWRQIWESPVGNGRLLPYLALVDEILIVVKCIISDVNLNPISSNSKEFEVCLTIPLKTCPALLKNLWTWFLTTWTSLRCWWYWFQCSCQRICTGGNWSPPRFALKINLLEADHVSCMAVKLLTPYIGNEEECEDVEAVWHLGRGIRVFWS